MFHTGRTVTGGIVKLKVFGRQWCAAQVHVHIYSQYVGGWGATAPRNSAKTEKKLMSTYLAKFYRGPGMSAVQTDSAVQQYVGSQKVFVELCPGPDSRSGGFLV